MLRGLHAPALEAVHAEVEAVLSRHQMSTSGTSGGCTCRAWRKPAAERFTKAHRSHQVDMLLIWATARLARPDPTDLPAPRRADLDD